jgi:hypothetical protein
MPAEVFLSAHAEQRVQKPAASYKESAGHQRAIITTTKTGKLFALVAIFYYTGRFQKGVGGDESL